MSVLAELKRRNVFRMAILYAVSSWLILQVGDVLFGVLGVPEWSLRLLLAFLALGFPLALIFSWVYELTPEGVKKDSEVDRSNSVAPQTGRKIDRLIIAVLAIAVALLLVDRWRGAETESVSISTSETDTDPVSALAEATPGDARSPRSIAVLPFEDFSGGSDQAWFAQGLSEEILNALSRTPDLLVASRTSSFQYGESDVPVTEIAAALGVAHVLEGSVRRTPERIRVTAQLIRAADGFNLWSEKYDRTPEDIIAIQEDIALSIARALETAMDPDALAAMMSTGTRSVEAYNAYLQAMAAYDTGWSEGNMDPQAAVDFAERAIKADPGFARAHHFLSIVYRGLANTSVMTRSPQAVSPEEYRRRYEGSIEAAITHASSGVDRLYYEAAKAFAQQRLALAEKNYRAYLKDRPNDALAIVELVTALVSRGDRNAALDMLHPLADGTVRANWSDLMLAANMFVFAGQPDAGVALFDDILTSDADNATVLYQKHRALLWGGRLDEAARVFDELRRVNMNDNQMANVAIRDACATDDREAAEAILDAMQPDHLYGRWYGNLLLGRPKRAAAIFAAFEDSEAGLDDLAGYLVHPHFDPRLYPRLMARVGPDLLPARLEIAEIPFACPPEVTPSIAILPFDSLSASEEDGYFATGVYEDILTHLSRIDGLRVISRTTMERIATTDLDVRAIGKRLEVRHVMEGSVRRAGNQVRVSVQLIDASIDEHVWAENYDRELNNVFAIQSEIARAVAGELETSLTPETVARIEQQPTENVVAYDYYLQARALVRRVTTPDDFSRAALLLEQALGVDPSFLDAKVLLAYASGRLVWNQRDPIGTHRERAEELIADLRKHDPNDPMTWLALGDFNYTVERNYEAALESYDRARAGLPENLELATQLVSTYKRLGRFDEAIAHAQEILIDDPDNNRVHVEMADTLTGARRFDEFLEHFEATRETVDWTEAWEETYYVQAYLRRGDTQLLLREAPRLGSTARGLAAGILAGQGEIDQALRLLPLSMENTPSNYYRMRVEHAAGHEVQARKLAGNLIEFFTSYEGTFPHPGSVDAALALFHALRGEHDAWERHHELASQALVATNTDNAWDAGLAREVALTLAQGQALAGDPEAAWESVSSKIKLGGLAYGPWAVKYDGYLKTLFGDLPSAQEFVAQLEAAQ